MRFFNNLVNRFRQASADEIEDTRRQIARAADNLDRTLDALNNERVALSERRRAVQESFHDMMSTMASEDDDLRLKHDAGADLRQQLRGIVSAAE